MQYNFEQALLNYDLEAENALMQRRMDALESKDPVRILFELSFTRDKNSIGYFSLFMALKNAELSLVDEKTANIQNLSDESFTI